jgi:hypothetical protein
VGFSETDPGLPISLNLFPVQRFPLILSFFGFRNLCSATAHSRQIGQLRGLTYVSTTKSLSKAPARWAAVHFVNYPFQYLLDSYPCRTRDGDEAAAFYVPIYTGMLHRNRTQHCQLEPCPDVPALARLGRLLGAHLNEKPCLRR